MEWPKNCSDPWSSEQLNIATKDQEKVTTMKKLPRVALLALLTLGLASRSAYAVPMLMLSDGTTTITITDNLAGDMNPMAGVIVFIGAVGPKWIVNTTTGLTKPVLGSATDPHMDINSVDVSRSTTPTTLTIKFSDTDFGPYSGPFADSIGGTVDSSGNGARLVATEYFDQANGNFSGFPDADNLIATLGPFGPGAFSGSVNSSPVDGENPFSLTQVVVITHNGRGGGRSQSTSFNYEKIAVVPEPSALLLLGSGLAGFGYLRRRARNR